MRRKPAQSIREGWSTPACGQIVEAQVEQCCNARRVRVSRAKGRQPGRAETGNAYLQDETLADLLKSRLHGPARCGCGGVAGHAGSVEQF